MKPTAAFVTGSLPNLPPADLMPLKIAEVRERTIPQALQPLYNMLHGQSGIMMRHSLEFLGCSVPATATIDEIARCAIASVADGDISLADGRAIAFGCREYSAKRCYLFQADAATCQQWRFREGCHRAALSEGWLDC